MSELQAAITAYQDRMLKLSGELGEEAQEQALENWEELMNDPYLSMPLKLTLQNKARALQAQAESNPEYQKEHS